MPMTQQEFLKYVLGDVPGYVEVVSGEDPTTAQWLPYPGGFPLIGQDISIRPIVVPTPGYDVSLNGISTNVLSADVDANWPLALPPSLQTFAGPSPHHMAYWKLNASISYSELDALRAHLDPFGQFTAYVPLPETTSTKWPVPPGEPLGNTTIEDRPTLRTWRIDEIRLLEPKVLAPTLTAADLTWVPDPLTLGTGVQYFLAARLPNSPEVARALGLNLARPKFSFDKLVAALLDAGFDLAETIWVSMQAVCNPYKGLAYGAVWETARHIARIAATFRDQSVAIIRQINAIRKRKGAAFARRQDVAGVVLEDLRSKGVFLHASDKTYWYVDHGSGEAMELGERNERLKIFVNRHYGLNPTDQDHRHVVQEIIGHAGALPRTSERTTLSYYRPGGGGDGAVDNGELFLHFGGRDIGLLTADGLAADPNGNSGLIFEIPSESDPIVTTNLRDDLPLNWWNDFLPPAYFRSLIGSDPEIACALIRVWVQFVLFREEARTRPILAFLGPIRSGKSTFSRRLYALFYGARKDLTGAPEGGKEYDTITSNNPFVVFDNLDHCPIWLPPRLEMSITPREQDRRKLFTDNTLYHIRCNAIVGVTAHDPSIFREGIIDRMLVLNFRQLLDHERLPESQLAREVTERREEFLSGLVSDARRILQTPRHRFNADDWEQSIRVMDFVDMGAWFAHALGVGEEFKQAISGLKRRQTGMILDGEASLVDALEAFAREEPERAGEWMNASQLWNNLADHTPDTGTFTMLYKTPAVLGTKLWSVYNQLREVTHLEVIEDPRTARRSWRISNGAPV